MGKKYAYGKRSDSELQLWPDTSTERYITRPFVAERVVGRKNKKRLFSWPKIDGYDPLSRYSIAAAACTEHKSDYYQSRSGADFHLAMYTVAGRAELSCGREKFSLSAGMFTLIPSGCGYELKSGTRGWKVLWFHLNPAVFIVRTRCVFSSISENCANLAAVFKFYDAQVYSKNPSRRILEALAEIMDCVLRADLSRPLKMSLDCGIESKIDRVKNTLSEDWDIVRAVKFFKLPPKRLDALFKNRFGSSFSKTLLGWRMDEARRIVSSKPCGLEVVARKVGYSDAFSLSKAFKRFFGKSPSDFRESGF